MNAKKRKSKDRKAHLRMCAWWGITNNVWTTLEPQTRSELAGWYHNLRKQRMTLDQFAAKYLLECDKPSKEVMYYVNCKRDGTKPSAGVWYPVNQWA